MQQFARRRFNRVSLLSVMAAALLAGLWWAKTGGWSVPWWSLLACAPAVIVGLRRRTIAALVVVAVCGGVAGAYRGGLWQQKLTGYQPYVGRQVVVTGHIRDDPAYDQRRQLDFRVDQVRIDGQKLPGQVRIKALGAAGVRGDTIQASGRLQSGFGNYQAAVSFARVKVVQRQVEPVERLRRLFFTGVYNALPDLPASLGLGFLVGLRTGLPDDFEAQLRLLALSHIVVASGYNLTILVRISRRLLAKFSKFQAFAGSLGLVLLMLTMTGLSPSMSRAGLVTFLSLSAWYYGRTVHPVLLLLLSGAITAWWNPLYIWSDLGWWLSFLAFAGVLLIAPLITKRLYGSRSPPLLPQIAIETLSAQLLVEPLIMLTFNQFSVLGLVANIVVVPFIPLAMVTTFIAGLAGMAIPAAAGWFGLPAAYVLGYIIEVVRWLASIPWASRRVTVGIALAALLYCCVLLLLLQLKRRTGHVYRQAPGIVE